MGKKDNSSSTSQLRRQMDALNEIAETEHEKLRRILEDLQVKESILIDFVNNGILGTDENEKLTMELECSEKVGCFFTEGDRKRCQEILLGKDEEEKDRLKEQLKEKMFSLFSKIVEELAEWTDLPFYVKTEKYSIRMPYSISDGRVFLEDFCFNFTVDIH